MEPFLRKDGWDCYNAVRVTFPQTFVSISDKVAGTNRMTFPQKLDFKGLKSQGKCTAEIFLITSSLS